MFLSLSGIIGKTQNEVAQCLARYCEASEGGLMKEYLDAEHNNCCVIKEAHDNTVVYYPSGFIEWEQSSVFLSKELNAPVFSFHVHDGDLWMYVLFVNGAIVDQFNPIPEYWDENIGEEEIVSWRGNATTVAKYVPGLKPESIQKYLVSWDIDEETKKAYETDEFVNEYWQLTDFMKKVGLTYPFDSNNNSTGTTYKLWTTQLRLRPPKSQTGKPSPLENASVQRKWWKFWK